MSSPAPAAHELVPADGFPGVRLHIVTGKGGTGKTTVAAALAMALARRGRRVLLAEVEDRQGISQTFDVPPLPTTETPVVSGADGGAVFGLAVDAKTALLEYLQLFYHLGRAGGVLERFGAIDFATTIAPGVRDVLLIGRVYEASRRRTDKRHHRHSRPDELEYDAIVLDAPPTGRIGRFLSVGTEVAGLARMGPIRSQADSLSELLRSATTRVHVVTLLEEMPVQETVDAVAELRRLGLGVGAVVINQARAGLHSDDPDDEVPAEIGEDELAADLRGAGLEPSASLVAGLARQVRQHAERVSLEDEQLAALAELQLPLVTVPFLVDGVDVDAVTEIGEWLAEQGMTP